MELTLGSDLARLVRIWRSLIDHRLKPLKLTQTHWITLYNISLLPPDQSQIQLAKAIGIEQPSLVRTLDQLEEKRLITRHIKLTEESEPFIREVDAVIEKTRREILGGITQDELYTLAEIVRKLDNNIVQLHNRN